MPRPGRNEPCHCGSGRKTKRCCGVCQGSRDFLTCDHGFSPPVIAGRSAAMASRWARMR